MVKRGTGFVVLVQVLLMTNLIAGALADEWRAAAAQALQAALQPSLVGEIAGGHDQGFDPCTALARFYRHRGYEPAWVDRDGLLPEGALVLAELRRAGSQGLLEADYLRSRGDDLPEGMMARPVAFGADDEDRLIELDLVVTETVLRYAYHRTVGRTDPDRIGWDRTLRKPLSADLALDLAQALEHGRLASFLEALGPQHRDYRALQNGLARYQQIQDAGGWPVIDEGPTLHPGDCGPRVAQLRHRLAAAGDIPLAESGDDCFDEGLAEAVARFQVRHGLAPDGVVGMRSLAALNVPVAQRVRQLQVNLERWRWMPEDLGPRYVLVNIPAFQMQIVEGGHVVKSLRTVVGRIDRPTPVLSGTITYLEINPYWHVPTKIARKDLLPKIKTDPGYLERENFRVFDGWDKDAREIDPLTIDWSSLSGKNFPFRLRQEPAAGNALGRVKFMFPNDQSIYIHDTPSRSLFNRPSRPFSSGCVRVEDPLVLAGLLLNGQHWDQARLSQAVASARRQVILLDEPVPVYLVYQTAWAAEDGAIHFGDDLYGHDRTHLKAMAASPPAPLACSPVLRQATYWGSL